MTDLLAALDSALATGADECLWLEQGGEYRWLFRRSGARLRIAVLWSTGTFTGWEHVFGSECDAEEFAGQARAGLAQVSR